jgi:hypothetical protein
LGLSRSDRHEVDIRPAALDRLAALITADRAEQFLRTAEHAGPLGRRGQRELDSDRRRRR